ncbi:MAG: hypothetical protein HY938_11130 [Nitrosomonadales bacterium]|nr:hypothetical protein [Nitrosomonadales bacterium]
MRTIVVNLIVLLCGMGFVSGVVAAENNLSQPPLDLAHSFKEASRTSTDILAALNRCSEDFGILVDNDLSIERRKCGSTIYAVLLHMTSRNESGEPIWELQDIIKFPDLKKGQGFGDIECIYELDRTSKTTVTTIAIVGPYIKSGANSFKTHVFYAIQTNLKTRKLEVLDQTKVSCDYEEVDDRD